MAEAGEIISDKGPCNIKSSKSQTSGELSEFLKSSVKNVLDHIADEQFVSLYKTCYKEFEKKEEIFRPSLSGSSAEGRKYHGQFKDMIMKSTYKTIDETILNMNLKLKELEELKQLQLNSNIYWRPPGNAEKHMIPFEFISEIEKKKDLEGKIEREQEALNVIKTRLIQKRNKANELKKFLISLISGIKSTVTSEVNDEQIKLEFEALELKACTNKARISVVNQNI